MKVLLVKPSFTTRIGVFATQFDSMISAQCFRCWDCPCDPGLSDHFRCAGEAANLRAAHYKLIAHLPSLTRILLKLGVLDRERKEFWRFLTKTLVSHRDRLVESLRLAAMGYHFRRLNDAYSQR